MAGGDNGTDSKGKDKIAGRGRGRGRGHAKLKAKDPEEPAGRPGMQLQHRADVHIYVRFHTS